MTTPVFTCTLLGPNGPLDLMAAPYDLEASSFSEWSVQWRKKHAENDYVEGEYLVSAVRQNVTETLAVWVEGATEAEVQAGVAALTAALEQSSYTLSFGVAGSTVTWSCEPAEYSVRREHTRFHAVQALVVAQVPRKPRAVT